MKHTIEITNVEALIILKGLRCLVENENTHLKDKDIAVKLIYSIENECMEDLIGVEVPKTEIYKNYSMKWKED